MGAGQQLLIWGRAEGTSVDLGGLGADFKVWVTSSVQLQEQLAPALAEHPMATLSGPSSGGLAMSMSQPQCRSSWSSVAHIPITATGLTWLPRHPEGGVVGEQIVTPASRRRHAPVTLVSSRCGRIEG